MAERKIVELARKARNGNNAAFEELCKRKTQSVMFNALGYVKNLADAEDIAQDVFILMFRNMHTLSDPETIDLWMLRIVQNRCLRFLEQNRKHVNNVDIDDEAAAAVEEGNKEFLPEAYAQDAEMRLRLYDIVMGLPEKRREAIIMYYYDDLSTKEIAGVTGTSVQNVTSSIAKARKMIKDEIERTNAGDLKALAGMAGSATVLGRALSDGAALHIPAQSATVVQGKVFAIVHAAQAGAGVAGAAGTTGAAGAGAGAGTGAAGTAGAGIAGAAGAAAAKGVAIALAVAVAAGGGALGFAVHSMPPGGTAAPAVSAPADAGAGAAEVNLGGEITFFGGYGEDGHINPAGAEITDHNIKIAELTWTIADEAGAVLYAGEGGDLSAPLLAMIENAAPGDYLLKYLITDEAGYVIAMQRVFEIE